MSGFILKYALGHYMGKLWKWILRRFRAPLWQVQEMWFSASLGEFPISPHVKRVRQFQRNVSCNISNRKPMQTLLFFLEWEDQVESGNGQTAKPKAVLSQAKSDSWDCLGVVSWYMHFMVTWTLSHGLSIVNANTTNHSSKLLFMSCGTPSTQLKEHSRGRPWGPWSM